MPARNICLIERLESRKWIFHRDFLAKKEIDWL